MADGLIQSRDPTETEFSNAVAIVTRYIEDPRSGWDRARGERVLNQLNAWQLLLFSTRMHAAHDAEKS